MAQRYNRLHWEDTASGLVLDVKVRAPQPQPRRLLFALEVTGPAGTSPNTVYGRNLTMRLLDNQEVIVTVREVDAFGDDVPADKRGQLDAVSSDESVVTVEPVADQTGQFRVRAVAGADGVSASVLISDSTDEDAEAEFQGSIDFDLVDHRRGEVAQLVVEAGTPTTQDAPTGGGDTGGDTGGEPQPV